jgi:hypothetical protein
MSPLASGLKSLSIRQPPKPPTLPAPDLNLTAGLNVRPAVGSDGGIGINFNYVKNGVIDSGVGYKVPAAFAKLINSVQSIFTKYRMDLEGTIIQGWAANFSIATRTSRRAAHRPARHLLQRPDRRPSPIRPTSSNARFPTGGPPSCGTENEECALHVNNVITRCEAANFAVAIRADLE